MKTLYIGDLRGYGRSFQRFIALKELGHEVKGFSSCPLGKIPGSKSDSIIEKIAYKLLIPLDITGINRMICSYMKKQKIDLLWIEKGVTIYPTTLRRIKKIEPSVKIASYTEDDMYALHNRSLYYTWGLKYYDIVFTTKSYNCNADELPALGARRVVFVDKAFDKNTHRPLPISNEDRIKLGSDVGFIGSFEKDRAEKMLFLAKNGIPVRIWGNGWKGWIKKHPALRIENQPIYQDDYVKAICATKINLCFLRKMNRDLQTDRTMEIPACGAFMLAERTDEHQRLFEERKEAAFFDIRNPQELLEKVQYYLAHEDERAEIGRRGRERCLKSGYSHHDRLNFMLNQIEEIQ